MELRQRIYLYLLPYTLSDTRAARCTSAKGSRSRNRAVIWQRGQTNLLCVCRRMHDECADLLYGSNVFMVSVTYSGITFRYQWLLESGLAPRSDMELVEWEQHLHRVRRMTVAVQLPDSYTGMIKYNVGGSGLAHGVKCQVEKLAGMLGGPKGGWSGLNVLHVELTDGDSNSGRAGGEVVLEPLRQLRGLVEVQVSGHVGREYGEGLARDVCG